MATTSIFKTANLSVIQSDATVNSAVDVTFGDATTLTGVSGDVVLSAGDLVHTLDNPNAYSTSASDAFGAAVAISGNYAIVGAYQEDDASGVQSGKAYIYNVTTGALVHTLNNPNAYGTTYQDYFGVSVAISGNYAIVGAYTEEGPGNEGDAGRAYIFNVTTGALVHTLNNPNAYDIANFDRFGNAVGISGNYAIVAASRENSASGTDSGVVYIFNVNTGALVHTITNPNPSQDDYFGGLVAGAIDISGNYAIVGSAREDSSGITDSGKVYIFNVTTGALVHTITNPDGISAYNYFGEAVAVSGNYAIVGVPNASDADGSGSGKAYIFNAATGALIHTLGNPDAYGTGAGDNFGSSVAIYGNYAIIVANREEDAGGTYSGKAYVFNIVTGEHTITIDNPNAYGTSADDYFGSAVAISANYAIVGVANEDDAGGTSSGKAYIFSVTDQTIYDQVMVLGIRD